MVLARAGGKSLAEKSLQVLEHLSSSSSSATYTYFDGLFEILDPSRRNSLEMDGNGREMFVVIPRERKMVSAPAIYDGMLRLNFLLEACQPGTIPDANLIAAVLDLVFHYSCLFTVRRLVDDPLFVL